MSDREHAQTIDGGEALALGTPAAAAATRNPRRGRLILIGLVSWSLLVASASFAGGWMVNDRWQASRTRPSPSIIEIPASQGEYEGTMPDLRGLGSSDARQVLVDVGFDPNLVVVNEVPWAGTPDLVVSQDPVAGEKVTDKVNLTVSGQASVPEVVGQHYLDAVNALRALGVEPEVVDAFDFTAPTGSVLAVAPAAGEPLPEVVQLTVAQPGSSMFFADLKAVDRICSSKDADLNGTPYNKSLGCSTGQANKPKTGVWLLDRRVQAISGVIGVDDKGKSDASAEVTVVGDGQVLGTFSTSYAQPADINISVTGVLRLEIVTTSATGSEVVLGTWLLKGTSDDITALESGA